MGRTAHALTASAQLRDKDAEKTTELLMTGDDSMRQAERSQRPPLRRFTYSRRGYEIGEVDRFVSDISDQLSAAQQRLQLLEHQLDQLSHENAALTQMINHVARLGEQMVAEARQEAHDIVSGARSEAQERVIVARADAKSLVSEERRRVADELEMLAIVRETVVAERDALLSFHSDLNGRLREIVTSIVNYSNDDEIHELAAIGGIISPERAPSRSARRQAAALAPDPHVEDDDDSRVGDTDDLVVSAAADTDTGDPVDVDVDVDAEAHADDGIDAADETDDAAAGAGADDPGATTDDDYVDFETAEMLADDSFDRAFTSFMGNELGAEPSRDWMINGE
jgi:cell division septum initiation protein DivIVA